MTLDIEQRDALLDWLQAAGHIARDEQPATETLAGGVSNRVVLVERPSGERWVLKQALEKLRVADDWFSAPERIHREALALRWLPRLTPAGSTTPFCFEDSAEHVLAMQAVPRPHWNWKSMLLAGELGEDHVAQFGRLLGTLHRRAFERPEEIARVFDDRSFFESLRLEPYYQRAAARLPEAAEFIGRLLEETRATRLTLVHGDYSPKNILVGQGRFVLLDHEVIHFGDPAFDLGFSLTHLLAKSLHVSVSCESFALAALHYWECYRESAGPVAATAGLERRAVRHTIACLLARVVGRSPLEYLTPAEQERQQRAALTLAARPPPTPAELIQRFVNEIATMNRDTP